MATVTAISTKGGGGGKGSLRYICRDDKTEQGRWVTAINCTPQTAYDEFRNTKQLYGKTDGAQYFHFVQSHPSGYEISPELALKIAKEFAEKVFKGFECVIACHTDAPHIHCHFIVNSVSSEDGHKFRSNKFTLKAMRELSDEICMKYGVATLDRSHLEHKSKGVSPREYHSGMKGESWKIELMNTIDYAMRKAKSKKHFLWLMRQEGYSVKWQDNHKYITYTCPNGCRVRDDKLHEEKYRKEMMIREFEIRGNEARLARERRESLGHKQSDLGVRQQLEGSDRFDTMSDLLTREDTQYLLKKIEQSSEHALTEQRKALQDLVKQAGKLNEQFSTQTKQLEEFKHKLKARMWVVIIISQASLALLLSGLGLWLR